MSVPAGKRHLSSVQYVDSSDKLYTEVITFCVKVRGKYAYDLTNQISLEIATVLNCIKGGYSIRPILIEDFKMRRVLFLFAFAGLRSIVTRIKKILEMSQTDPKDAQRVIASVENELNLLQGRLDDDLRCYRKLLSSSPDVQLDDAKILDLLYRCKYTSYERDTGI